MPVLMYRNKLTLRGRTRVEMSPFVMRMFLISLPVSAMIGKQVKNFKTAKIFKKVCKTLFVTVTILSPNVLLYLYLYTIFDQRRLDIIDQVEHGRSPQQVTHLPPVWDLLLPLA